MAVLDTTGLTYLWSKIKAYFTTKVPQAIIPAAATLALGVDCNTEVREWHLGGSTGSTNYPSTAIYWYVNTICFERSTGEITKKQIAYRYTGAGEVWTRLYYGAAWTAWNRVDLGGITSGTAAPSGGADGDIYFRYT